MFFETTIMGNTADLAMVQKTNIDTLHKESKSQRVITERGGCSRSAVSKYIKYKVDWKEEFGSENMHKKQGWPQAWEYCQAKLIQTLGRASQGVNWRWSHQESPRSDIFRKRATKPLLKQKHHQKYLTWAKEKKNWTAEWSKVLFSDESTFSFPLEIKVPESGGRVERNRKHVAWSPVWSFHSQWWVGLPCPLLVLVHCVFWSPKSTQPSTRKF